MCTAQKKNLSALNQKVFPCSRTASQIPPYDSQPGGAFTTELFCVWVLLQSKGNTGAQKGT